MDESKESIAVLPHRDISEEQMDPQIVELVQNAGNAGFLSAAGGAGWDASGMTAEMIGYRLQSFRCKRHSYD